MQRITKTIKGTSVRSDRPLTDDQIMEVAPSVFALAPHEDRSDRYAFTSTIDMVNALRDQGFFPFFAAQSGTRDESKKAHVRHMLRLRRENAIDATSAKEIVMINDSAGGGCHQLTAGILEFVCMNGCVAGQIAQTVKVRHTGSAMDNVIEGAYTVLTDFERIDQSMDTMKSIELTPYEQQAFARSALSLRFDGEPPVQAHQLLRPLRDSDRERSLWRTFQMVQEKLVRGGVHGVTTGSNGRRRNTTTRAVNAIGDNVRLNQALWDLAEAMTAIKQGEAISSPIRHLEVA